MAKPTCYILDIKFRKGTKDFDAEQPVVLQNKKNGQSVTKGVSDLFYEYLLDEIQADSSISLPNQVKVGVNIEVLKNTTTARGDIEKREKALEDLIKNVGGGEYLAGYTRTVFTRLNEDLKAEVIQAECDKFYENTTSKPEFSVLVFYIAKQAALEAGLTEPAPFRKPGSVARDVIGGVTPPTGGSTPPTGGSTPPTGGTTPPSGGTTPPSGGTTPPTGGTTPPTGGSTTPPTGGSTPPTGGTTPPTGGTTPPTGGSTPPTGGTTPPSGGTTPPSGGTTPPTGGTTPPTGGTTPPTGGTTPPTGGSTPPTGGTTPPTGGTTPPTGGSTPPSGGSTPPTGGSTPPSGGSTPPHTKLEAAPEKDARKYGRVRNWFARHATLTTFAVLALGVVGTLFIPSTFFATSAMSMLLLAGVTLGTLFTVLKVSPIKHALRRSQYRERISKEVAATNKHLMEFSKELESAKRNDLARHPAAAETSRISAKAKLQSAVDSLNNALEQQKRLYDLINARKNRFEARGKYGKAEKLANMPVALRSFLESFIRCEFAIRQYSEQIGRESLGDIDKWNEIKQTVYQYYPGELNRIYAQNGFQRDVDGVKYDRRVSADGLALGKGDLEPIVPDRGDVPTGGATPPTGGVTPPTSGTTPPTGDMTPPTDGTTPPTDDGATPPEGTPDTPVDGDEGAGM